MRPHKLEDGRTDLLSGSSTDSIFCYLFLVFASTTRRLVMKLPLRQLDGPIRDVWMTGGQQGEHCEFH